MDSHPLPEHTIVIVLRDDRGELVTVKTATGNLNIETLTHAAMVSVLQELEKIGYGKCPDAPPADWTILDTDESSQKPDDPGT
jgi:hypothetical protein